MKDADKLKLMLLAWNYQNSNAGKNLTTTKTVCIKRAEMNK